MFIRCEQELLAASLGIVTRAMPSRTTIPVLENVFIETAQDHINMICTDLQLGIQTQMEAQVEEEGCFLLPGRLLSDMVRKLPKGEVTIQIKNKKAIIRCSSSRFTLTCHEPDEFPSLPDVVSSKPIILPQKSMREMIRQTYFAASADESRIILTGVLMELHGNSMRTVALDGFRLALHQCPLGEDYGDMKAVIPAKSLAEVSKVLTEDDEKVYLTITPTHFMADVGNTRVITRLLEGEYIKYTQILPGEWQTRALVNCAEMSASIDRASTMAREDSSNLIRLSMTQGDLVMTADSEIGKVVEKLSVELEGKDLEIAFNAKYMADVLKSVEDESVYLCFNTNVSPCVIRPVQGDTFLFLVLPVRVYA